ncbi:UPF0187 protein mll4386 [Frankliniella fusca]|uniref:UPF0187 protein mll4386 n=1 Tax=Frankliniella fusca TaxID=407009 RepID=A0AAE1LRG6_9NEOP|nr:UPF0187 protein mll4386 [Frankliniella fusca]
MDKRAKRELLDKLHRGFVKTMMGITCFGLIGISFNLYVMFQNAKAKEKLMLADLDSKEDIDEFPSVNVYEDCDLKDIASS